MLDAEAKALAHTIGLAQSGTTTIMEETGCVHIKERGRAGRAENEWTMCQ